MSSSKDVLITPSCGNGLRKSDRVKKGSCLLVGFETPDAFNTSAKENKREKRGSPSIKVTLKLGSKTKPRPTKEGQTRGKNRIKQSQGHTSIPIKNEPLSPTVSECEFGLDVPREIEDDNATLDEKRRGESSGKTRRATRNDKGKPRMTAYILWAREQRQILAKAYPKLDLSSRSKKLNELWGNTSANEKMLWKSKAAKLRNKNSNMNGNINIKNSGSMRSNSGKAKKSRGRPRTVNAVCASPTSPIECRGKNGLEIVPPIKRSKFVRKKSGRKSLDNKDKNISPIASSSNATWKYEHVKNELHEIMRIENASTQDSTLEIPASASAHKYAMTLDDLSPVYNVTGTSFLDIAAHFALLGESLTSIGEGFKRGESEPASGSMSVLLSSLLCGAGALLCLTQQVPELNCIPQEKLDHLMDNVNYITPVVDCCTNGDENVGKVWL